jgi:hypothetical protein
METTTTEATTTPATTTGASESTTTAATTTPPAQTLIPPTTAPADAGGYVAPDGSFVQGWTDKLPEELGESRASFGKFKSVQDLAKSYTNLEKRLGKAATAVLVPGENATPEEKAAYRKAIGAFETVDEYAKLQPESLPEGVAWNADLARPVLELAHEYSIPAEAVKKYLALRVQQEAGRTEVIGAELQKQLDDGTALLQKEWGTNYGSNIQRVAQAVRMVGLDPDTTPGLRDPETVKIIQRLSTKISDDEWRTATASTNSPAMSAKDIQTNPSNPLYERYQKGDAAVVAQVRDLLKQGR